MLNKRRFPDWWSYDVLSKGIDILREQLRLLHEYKNFNKNS